LRPASAGFLGLPVAENGVPTREVRDARVLDRAAQLTNLREETGTRAVCARSGIGDDARCHIPFARGEITERTIAAERLGPALSVTVRGLPSGGELTVELDGVALSQIVSAKPLGADTDRVLAIAKVIDEVCDGTLSAAAARSALESAGRLPPASTRRFTCFAAIGDAHLASFSRRSTRQDTTNRCWHNQRRARSPPVVRLEQ